MKKTFKHTDLNPNVPCRVCGTFLKENVTQRKPTADLCFKHYREQEANKGHDMSTAREVRQGKRPAKKYRETIAETKKKLAKEEGK
jgi:hypothetical protein